MLFNFEDKSNNFEFVNIPSNRKLFEQMGFSRDELHPDGQDPETFTVPENYVGEYSEQVARQVIESDMRSHMSAKDVVDVMNEPNTSSDDKHE